MAAEERPPPHPLLDDQAASLAEASRILAPGGSIAILDWRKDVEQPPGPPLEHRIPPSEVARALEQHGWRIDTAEALGTYNYLIVAARDQRRDPSS